ncbi:hypothetical protein AGMMS50256_29960 [Betaproteobacteria bacterium]|nr:hypothetical protein AGMMS50256_29960 [Betaproteobacteria bacterium]
MLLTKRKSEGFRIRSCYANPAFVESTRWIGNPQVKNDLHDYDALFKPESEPRKIARTQATATLTDRDALVSDHL